MFNRQLPRQGIELLLSTNISGIEVSAAADHNMVTSAKGKDQIPA